MSVLHIYPIYPDTASYMTNRDQFNHYQIHHTVLDPIQAQFHNMNFIRLLYL